MPLPRREPEREIPLDPPFITGEPSRRKPHNTDAGYIASRRHPTVKGMPGVGGEGWVVIYEAEAQGIDTEGARYVTVCWTHHTLIEEPTLKGA